MNISCEIIKDLLPLYHEEVCSIESKDMVENHLSECDACREIINKMKNDHFDDTLQEEKTTILSRSIQKINKMSKFFSFGCATLITIPLVISLIMGIIGYKYISVSSVIISAIIIAIAYLIGLYIHVPLKFIIEQYGKTKKKSFYIGVWLAFFCLIPIIITFTINLADDKTLDEFYPWHRA